MQPAAVSVKEGLSSRLHFGTGSRATDGLFVSLQNLPAVRMSAVIVAELEFGIAGELARRHPGRAV